MKKSSILFLLFFAAALPAFSASTCETRVDAHQDATTLERANYCLMPEAQPPAPASAKVVYYNVTDKTPQTEEEQKTRYKQKYFDQDGVAVSQGYVETTLFPAFTNDTLSEQERLALEQAEKEALEKARAEALALLEKSRQSDGSKSAAEEEKEPEMSKAQLAARKNKPNRVLKEAAQEQEAAPAEQTYPQDAPADDLQPAQTYANIPADDLQPYSADTNAQPAQAWDNNPYGVPVEDYNPDMVYQQPGYVEL